MICNPNAKPNHTQLPLTRKKSAGTRTLRTKRKRSPRLRPNPGPNPGQKARMTKRPALAPVPRNGPARSRHRPRSSLRPRRLSRANLMMRSRRRAARRAMMWLARRRAYPARRRTAPRSRGRWTIQAVRRTGSDFSGYLVVQHVDGLFALNVDAYRERRYWLLAETSWP